MVADRSSGRHPRNLPGILGRNRQCPIVDDIEFNFNSEVSTYRRNDMYSREIGRIIRILIIRITRLGIGIIPYEGNIRCRIKRTTIGSDGRGLV
jgi:hypothetical protein